MADRLTKFRSRAIFAHRHLTSVATCLRKAGIIISLPLIYQFIINSSLSLSLRDLGNLSSFGKVRNKSIAAPFSDMSTGAATVKQRSPAVEIDAYSANETTLNLVSGRPMPILQDSRQMSQYLSDPLHCVAC